MSEQQKKRGRPPLFGVAMTPQERKQRYHAARSKRLRQSAPDFPGVRSAEEVAAMLGLSVMPPDQLAALQALPGAIDWDDPDQPPLGPDGEPIFDV
jgi:hypothetical protein